MLLGLSSPIHFLGMSEQGLFDIHGAGFCIFVFQNLPAWTRQSPSLSVHTKRKVVFSMLRADHPSTAQPILGAHRSTLAAHAKLCLVSKLVISKKSESETQSLFPAALASHLLKTSRGVGTIHRAVALPTFSGTTPIRKTLLVPFLVCTFLNSFVFLTKRILCSHLFLLPRAFFPEPPGFVSHKHRPSVPRCL